MFHLLGPILYYKTTHHFLIKIPGQYFSRIEALHLTSKGLLMAGYDLQRAQVYSLWAFYKPWTANFFENKRDFEERMLH